MTKETYDIELIFQELFPEFYKQRKLLTRMAYNKLVVILDNNMELHLTVRYYRDKDHLSYVLSAHPNRIRNNR